MTRFVITGILGILRICLEACSSQCIGSNAGDGQRKVLMIMIIIIVAI